MAGKGTFLGMVGDTVGAFEGDCVGLLLGARVGAVVDGALLVDGITLGDMLWLGIADG